MTRSRAMLGGTGAPEPRRLAPRQADPLRRSEERPSSACQIYDGSGEVVGLSINTDCAAGGRA
jgi:hypothetical protein